MTRPLNAEQEAYYLATINDREAYEERLPGATKLAQRGEGNWNSVSELGDARVWRSHVFSQIRRVNNIRDCQSTTVTAVCDYWIRHAHESLRGDSPVKDEYPNIPKTVSAQLDKENKMDKLFELVPTIRGQRATETSEDQIYAHIATAQARIDQLAGMKNQPKSAKKEVKRIQKEIDALIEWMDAR